MVAVEVGPEFIVNSIIDGNQYRPFMTSLSTGGFLVGWQDASGKAGAQTDDDVRFSLYDTFGNRLQADALANTAFVSSQFEGSAAALKDGKFVIAWTDYSAAADSKGNVDTNNGGVKFQIYNDDGSPSGGEIHANPTEGDLDALRQDQPSVAALANGKFVVSWTSQVGVSGLTDIIVRLFNADGSPAGSQKTVNTQLVGDQNHSKVLALSNGGFAVVWADTEDTIAATGFEKRTLVRFYDAGANPIGVPVEANSNNAAEPGEVDITELTTGAYVISWTENQTAAPGDASGTSIRARIYNPVTQTSFRVNTSTSNDQEDAQVAALDHGQFVVAWTDLSKSGADTSDNAVRLQVFDSTGAKVGGQVLVNDETTFEQANPVLTVLPDFRFVVAWEDNSHTGSDDKSHAVHAQIFDARVAGIDIDGDAAGNDFAGSQFGDTMNGLAGGDKLYGGDGIDFLFGGLGRDLLKGDNGNDELKGGSGNDKLFGGAGADALDGGKGADVMKGGNGNDTYYVDDVGDEVIELSGQGTDTVKTTLFSYVLDANVERLQFTGKGNFTGEGNGLANVLTGGKGDDVLRADAGGADKYFGEGGKDKVSYSTSLTAANLNFATKVFGGAATGDSFDSIEIFEGSSSAADTMTAGGTGLTFFGLGGDDKLSGGSSADTLSGGAGIDDLRGNGGGDTLQGGSGDDDLRGGFGADRFVFTEIKFLGFTLGYGADDVLDFDDGTDKLRFANAVADAFGDLTVTGNNSTAVTVSTSHGSVVLHSTSAINFSTADVEFFTP